MPVGRDTVLKTDESYQALRFDSAALQPSGHTLFSSLAGCSKQRSYTQQHQYPGKETIALYQPTDDIRNIKIDRTETEVHGLIEYHDGAFKRFVTANDATARWRIGNMFFNTGEGAEAYSIRYFGGDREVQQHVLECTSDVLFTSDGHLVPK